MSNDDMAAMGREWGRNALEAEEWGGVGPALKDWADLCRVTLTREQMGAFIDAYVGVARTYSVEAREEERAEFWAYMDFS